MYYTLTNSTLAFILEGSEQILALRAKVSVDKKDIIDIQWHEVFNDWSTLTIRLPGSYLPSWVMAGSYWSEGGWDFVFAKKPKGLLMPKLHSVIVVQTKKPRYKRLIIETTHKNANEIISWWKEPR
jgi:hypothetical protein